ncbi:MAG TPA: VC0807 family protein [Mycobacteriales bacterium]|nr:VC0807 family protein [Mycobacteriales bacterium]
MHLAEQVVHLPSARVIARRTTATLIESTIIPLALFYAVLATAGTRCGIIAGLSWSYAAVLRRIVSGRSVPGMLILATMLVTARAAIAFATGSAFVYFLQPTLGTFVIAGLFLLSVPMGRPIVAKLADDFCPLPESMRTHPHVERFFLRLSVLWGFVHLINATVTLWLLFHERIGTFLVVKSIGSMALTCLAALGSFVWFRVSMRRGGLVLRWSLG